MNEQEYAAMVAKYHKVMQEEGHLHPGMIYDPVLDQWNHAGMEAALYQLFTGKSPHGHAGTKEGQDSGADPMIELPHSYTVPTMLSGRVACPHCWYVGPAQENRPDLCPQCLKSGVESPRKYLIPAPPPTGDARLRAIVREEVDRALNPGAIDPREYRHVDITDADGKRWRGMVYLVEPMEASN